MRRRRFPREELPRFIELFFFAVCPPLFFHHSVSFSLSFSLFPFLFSLSLSIISLLALFFLSSCSLLSLFLLFSFSLSLSLSPTSIQCTPQLHQALRRTRLRRRDLLLLVRHHARHRRGLARWYRRPPAPEHAGEGGAGDAAGEGRREGAGVLSAGPDVAGRRGKGPRGAGKERSCPLLAFRF